MTLSLRFTLKQMLYGVAVLAAGGVLSSVLPSVFGLLAAVFVLAYWGYVFAGLHRTDRAISAAAMAGIVLISWQFLQPILFSQQHVCDVRRRSRAYHNLEKIALALRNYHDELGQYPPPFLADESGRRTHRWTAILAPYAELSDFKAHYRFDEPWDSAHNLPLDAAYERELEYANWRGRLRYDLVLGATTIWPEAGAARKAAEPANTVMLVERLRDEPWTAPADPTLDEFIAEESHGGGAPQHYHGQSWFLHGGYGRHVALANGRVVFLPRNPTPEEWRQLLAVDRHTLKVGAIQPRLSLDGIRWESVIPALVFTVLAAAPVLLLFSRRGRRRELVVTPKQ